MWSNPRTALSRYNWKELFRPHILERGLRYEKILKKKFPKQVRDLYVQYVRKQAECASDRKQYKELVQYLKKIRKYPEGDTLTNEIAREWKEKYRRRPAMMDELRTAKF